MMRTTGLLLILCLAVAIVTPVSAQESQPASRPATQPASQPTSGPTTTAATTTSTATTTSSQAAEEEEPDRYLAVIGGRVHTMTGPVLDGATVLTKNGVIEAIGTDVQLPPECEIVDASGRFVYPGLVAANSTGVFAGSDPRDRTNMFSLPMTVALAGGITTARTGATAAKLTYGTTEDMLIERDLFITLRYRRSSPLQRAELRADFERVRDYLRDMKKYEQEKERDEDAEEPDAEWLKGKYEQYKKLIEGSAVAYADASSLQDLVDYAKLSQQFGFKLIVNGAVEGWIVADELGRANIGAIVSPRVNTGFGASQWEPDERYNRPNGWTIENAARLHNHGVVVAVIPGQTSVTFWGLAGRDLLHLAMEAAFAVRGGLSNEAALRAITIDAARLMGIDDRVGSLEVGKDADIVVADGDLLHYMTQVHYTIVNGRVAYDKSEETLFAHIRPDGRWEVPEFDDQWPRRLEWPEED